VVKELRRVCDLRGAVTIGYPVTELVLTGKTIRAKIDTRDLPAVLSVSTRWHAQFNKESRTHYVSATGGKIRLHRVVMGYPLPCFQVDHINHEGLDNRRRNLRIATQAQNSANTRHELGQSGYRNVNVVGGRYRASVMVNGKRHIMGLFPTAAEAGQAAREFREKAGLL
jgi:hypothetical protein